MAEEFLDGAEIGAVIEEVGGEAVPQFVWSERGIQTGGGEIDLQTGLDFARSDGLGTDGTAEEDGGIGGVRVLDDFPVFVDGGEGGFTDRHLTFLAALATDVKEALGGVELADGELAGFTNAEAGRVKEFEHGPVAEEQVGTDRFVGVGGLALTGEFGQGRGEQGRNVGFLKEAGEATGEFGESKLAGRGGGAETFADEPFEEGAERAEPEGNGGRMVFPAAQPAEVESEFVPGDGLPIDGSSQVLLMPGGEFGDGLAVVADGVAGHVPSGFQMQEETVGEGIRMGGRLGHGPRLHRNRVGCESWFMDGRNPTLERRNGRGELESFVWMKSVSYADGVEPRHAYIALNLIEHIGPVRLRQLLSHFGTAEAVLRASARELERVPGIGAEVAAGIAGWEKAVDLEGELKRIKEYGCQVWCQEDAEYPALLREIYDPPIVLYVRGELREADRNSLAVVGSRQTTAYGMEVARRFAYQLAYTGVTVVSGGARGIDTTAHLGALAAGGRTVAVLGTGINLVFPSENRDLFERIAGQGAVITQFPFNRPADKQSFPIRNRIVAGMTMGTVVVEANLTSGAMITANFAVDYGRQVFAVPGRIDSPRSRGCHELIRKGAKLCEGLEDILPEFEYLFPPANRTEATGPGRSPGLALSESEQTVLGVMEAGEWEVNVLVQLTSMPASAVSVALFSLEMKRLVRQLPGRRFVRASG